MKEFSNLFKWIVLLNVLSRAYGNFAILVLGIYDDAWPIVQTTKAQEIRENTI